jgi:amino acid adenylation domain-containing protein
VVGILGILKAGGVYVPLDAGYPEERLAFMIEDSQPLVVVTDKRIPNRLPPSYKGRIVVLKEEWNTIAEESTENLKAAILPENAIYVIYTSGSSGKPKGVVVTHYNVIRLIQQTNHWFKFSHLDVWTLFHSYAFDFSVWELWGALLYGGRLVVVPYWISRSTEDYWKLLAKEKVTVLNQTPSAFRQLMQVDEAIGDGPGLSIRVVIFGGEALEFQSLRAWMNRHAEQHALVNMYGITETTVHVTYHPIMLEEVNAEDTRSRIGMRIPDLKLYVLDEQMHLVPAGMRGELYVGGGGLARGYLHRPDLTAERFVPSPYETGARLYRTGDQVSQSRDGSLEYFGRLDQQIKIRGFRVEPGEIEAALAHHAGVRQVVVVAKDNSVTGRFLVAYVVKHADWEALDSQVLRNYLKESLPDYMVPAVVMILESFPLTANGKVDRRRLPEPEHPNREHNAGNVHGMEEEILSGIFADVLGLPAVGTQANFFELGGHSLLATQLVSRIRSVFGVDLPLLALFESPTVRGLAANLRQGTVRALNSGQEIIHVKRDGDLPLSYAQQRIWFLDQLRPGNTAYNLTFGLRLNGELNKEALHKSLREIIARHEVLRTGFPAHDGQPVQQIFPDIEWAVENVDLTRLQEADVEEKIRQLKELELQQGFDLSCPPLIRVKCLELNGVTYVLLVTIHHIVSDGWSLGILIHEFTRLYGAYCKGEVSPLSELPIQYADFAVWQRKWLSAEVLEEQLAYWRAQLKGMTILELPGAKSRSSDYRRGILQFELARPLADKLKETSRNEDVTLFMTLLAIFNVLLFRYTRKADLALGMDIANRTRIETEGLIGFFVNQLVLRTDLSGNPSFRELLRRVRKTTLDAYRHQDLPFERVVQELHPQRDLSHAPLFRTKMIFLNLPHESLALDGLKVSVEPIESDSTKLDLTLSLREASSGIAGRLEYNASLFEPATMENLATHFEGIARQIAENVHIGIDDVSLISQAEQVRVVDEFCSDTDAFTDLASV